MKKWIIYTLSGFLTISFLLFMIMIPIYKPFSNRTKTIQIHSDEEFGKYNFEGTGTINDPYLIQNLELGITDLYLDDFYSVISIANTSKHFIIQDCIISGGAKSIILNNIADGSAKILNNTLIAYAYYLNNSEITTTYGIKIKNSDFIEIRNNHFKGKEYSLNRYAKFASSICLEDVANCIIDSNYFEQSSIPIECLNSKYISIVNNYCNFELDVGLLISNCYFLIMKNNSFEGYVYTAFYLSYSSYVYLINNSFSSSTFSTAIRINYCYEIILHNNTINKYFTGIRISYSSGLLISYNLIKLCNEYAIDLYFSVNQTRVFHNDFLNNNLAEIVNSQCNDNCFSNEWYDKIIMEGNYWSDLGENIFYEIDGDANAVDLYPLLEPIMA